METVSFDKLLLKTAFCCMASDGNIDNREVQLIKKMCESSTHFSSLNFNVEINFLVEKINTRGKEFISYYLDLLDSATLSESEELILINFAIETIKADDQIEYSEIKFFKNIRHRLKISNENILKIYPDIEQFLEEDIVNDLFLDKLKSQFMDTIELPKFELINIVNPSSENN
jgi:uncharacterized tellurite resistance protein B-like protein